jgi:multidrug efflux pump subunit AcrB
VVDTKGDDAIGLREAARNLSDGIKEIPGISGVRLQGAGEPELRVLLNRRAMEDSRLSVAEVAGVLRRSSLSIPIGSIQSDRKVR